MIKGFATVLIVALIAAAWYYVPANSHRRAATGTYFLNQYISFTTPNGMTGWGPGQEVHEVLKAPFVQGNKTVTDGTFSALLPETVLTQDIDDAEAMRLADNESQARETSGIAAAKLHEAKQVFSAQMASAEDIKQMRIRAAEKSAPRATPTPPPTPPVFVRY